MHRGSRGLEGPLEDSSEEDLERERGREGEGLTEYMDNNIWEREVRG